MSGEVTQYQGKFREKPVSINSGVKFETILECKLIDLFFYLISLF